MRKKIFKAIAEALANVQGVEFVDLWNNQIQTINGGLAFPTAAVFIEFEELNWKQQNMGTRRGSLGVRLHVITRAVVTRGFDDPKIDEALALFDLLDNINAVMQGLRGEHFTGIMLTTSATNHDHTELIESVERYVLGVQDITSMRPVNIISGLSAAVSSPD